MNPDEIGNRWYRKPRTNRERRLDPDRQDVPYKVRAKRNRKNLPTNWDDLHIARREDKSWKTKRKQKFRQDDKSQFREHKVVLCLSDWEYFKKLIIRLEKYDYHYEVEYNYLNSTRTVSWYGKDVS
jgi:hypothetical protein